MKKSYAHVVIIVTFYMKRFSRKLFNLEAIHFGRGFKIYKEKESYQLLQFMELGVLLLISWAQKMYLNFFFLEDGRELGIIRDIVLY